MEKRSDYSTLLNSSLNSLNMILTVFDDEVKLSGLSRWLQSHAAYLDQLSCLLFSVVMMMTD